LSAFELSQLEEQVIAALKAEKEDVKEIQVWLEVISEKGGKRVHGFVCCCILCLVTVPYYSSASRRVTVYCKSLY